MLPLPTKTAVTAFVGAVLMLAIGVGASSSLAVILASTICLGLSLALALTLPIGARLRSERLELSFWHSHGHGEGHGAKAGGAMDSSATRGAVVVGGAFEVRAALRHRGNEPLWLCELLPALPEHVRCIRGRGADVLLPPNSRSELTFVLVANSAGRVVMHGLSVAVPGPLDLFRAPLYFPIPLSLRALPRASARTFPAARANTSFAIERVGQTQRRRLGGTELRELRELQPGDSFKTIAWKASAKTGRLMVREVESEVQDTLQIILDVSGSMRGGELGTRKLDHGIELAARLARDALDTGDRVGVITVDGRIVSQALPAEGLGQLGAIHDVLLASTEVIDQDLTDVDDDELIAIVARYVRHQDGADYSTASGIDVDALVRHAVHALSGEHESRPTATHASHGDVVASDRRTKILRRFCRLRGLALRYRSETRGFAKGTGLSHALQEAAGKGRTPRSIVVISDFDGVFQLDALKKTLQLLRARRHAISFVFPDARVSVSSHDPLRADLETVYGLGEERRLQEARSMLGKLGIPLQVSSAIQRPPPTAAGSSRA